MAAAEKLFGTSMEQSPDYGRIISASHFERLLQLSQTGKATSLGQANPETRFFPLTLIEDANPESTIMQEEILAPFCQSSPMKPWKRPLLL